MKLDQVVRKAIKEANEWDEKYLEVNVHSLELYEKPEKLQQSIQRFLGYKNRGEFKLTNPHSKRLWLPELLHSFLRVMRTINKAPLDDSNDDLKVACTLITLTHQDWACSDGDIQFDIGRAKRMVRNALVGVDFIGCFEAAAYNNESWRAGGSEGKLISFHCHVIAWASSHSMLWRLRKRIGHRFKPLLQNRSGIHLKTLSTVGQLVRTATYMAKMPALGYRTIKKSNGKKYQKHSKISFKSRHHLFSELSKYNLFQFWLSGGDGVAAIRAARAKLKGYEPDLPRIQRPRREPKYSQL